MVLGSADLLRLKQELLGDQITSTELNLDSGSCSGNTAYDKNIVLYIVKSCSNILSRVYMLNGSTCHMCESACYLCYITVCFTEQTVICCLLLYVVY